MILLNNTCVDLGNLCSYLVDVLKILCFKALENDKGHHLHWISILFRIKNNPKLVSIIFMSHANLINYRFCHMLYLSTSDCALTTTIF